MAKHPYSRDIQPKERREPWQTVLVRAACINADCGGELRGTGYGMTTNATHWVNRCEKCGDEWWLDDSYPVIRHVPAPAREDSPEGDGT